MAKTDAPISRWNYSKVRRWCTGLLLAYCFIVTVLQNSEAVACVLASDGRTPFFTDIPTNMAEPIIAEITVTSLLESGWDPKWTDPPGKRRSFNVVAHVDRVIKGSMDREIIKVAAPPSSCDRPLAVGDSGIVIGTVRSLPQGDIELRLVSQPIDEDKRRREFRSRQ